MLLLLSGPAGAGTSSAAIAWASRGSSPRVVIDVDGIRWMMRAGRADPEDGWTDETARQWSIAAEVAYAMVRVYHSHGVDCVIDVYAPPHEGDPWEALIRELGGQRVILLPQLEICLQRNRKRARTPFLEDDDVRGNYADFAECVAEMGSEQVIDNGALSVEETVDAIEA